MTGTPQVLSVSPVQYSTGTASQSYTTVTGVGTAWTSSMVGSELIFANGVSAGIITAFGSATSLAVTTSQIIAPQAYTINFTGLQVTYAGGSPTAALLEIGSSGSVLGTIQLEGSTSGSVQLQPAAAAGSWTMTLPTSAGTNGNVLQTDGTGVTSWVAQSGSGTANALASATTTVNVSSAPAPVAGQVLTATSSTAATWQTSSNLSWQAVQTSAVTAVAGNAYPVNTTSAPITVTLPGSPSAGNQVAIVDYAGTSGTNNITIANNGNNINGVAANVIINGTRTAMTLTYIDATQGWVATAASTQTAFPYPATYLMIGGGGGGGGDNTGGGGGGGGGAGGYLTGPLSLVHGTTYTIVIGAGGSGGPNSTTNGSTGGSTTVTSLTTSLGGGGGLSAQVSTGGNGASGGGGSTSGGSGSGTAGQGHNGGTDSGNSAGGGGGASAVGGNGSGSNGGAGGAGTEFAPNTTYYAGGGGGGVYSGTGGVGGNGGGGAGASSGNGTAGTANTGGGGGGSSGSGSGGAGGSGVVILIMSTAIYTGTTTGSPTVTTSGSNTILTYTASGSYTA